MAMQSLTRELVASDQTGFKTATQSDFLHVAAQGKLSKQLLGRWLANDRLYIHGYIHGIGRMLSCLDPPCQVPDDENEKDTNDTRLLDWLSDALVNIRREERFFVSTARQYGINVNLEAGRDGKARDEVKLQGLREFEALFGSLEPSQSNVLPWLESAVVFWGTEKCYLEAWSWAKHQMEASGSSAGKDADEGALRKEFIPNWTGKEFVAFVDALGTLIDEAVEDAVREHGDHVRAELMDRALGRWKVLLKAEQAFWPSVE